jgi:hypothetical protein
MSDQATPTGAARKPATIDGATLTVLPTPRRRKAQLDRLEGVRVEMARVYREMESGSRDSQDGSRLVYVLTQIAKVLELTEIERRLNHLEGQANRRQLPAPLDAS